MHVDADADNLSLTLFVPWLSCVSQLFPAWRTSSKWLRFGTLPLSSGSSLLFLLSSSWRRDIRFRRYDPHSICLLVIHTVAWSRWGSGLIAFWHSSIRGMMEAAVLIFKDYPSWGGDHTRVSGGYASSLQHLTLCHPQIALCYQVDILRGLYVNMLLTPLLLYKILLLV